MPAKAQMYLSDEVDSGFDARWIHFPGIQFPRTKIVIDVPDALAVTRGRSAKQRRARAVQANGSQPALGQHFVPLRDFRFQALDYDRTLGTGIPGPIIVSKTQAKHPLSSWLKRLFLDQPAATLLAVQQLAERLTQFR